MLLAGQMLSLAFGAPPPLPAVDPLRLNLKHPAGLGAGVATPLSLQPGFDVLHYDLRVEIDPATRFVEVDQQVEVLARMDDPGPLLLHSRSTELLSLTVDGAAVPWTQDEDELFIDLPGPIQAGDRVVLRVLHRPPGAGSETIYGLNWGDPTWSMHQPRGARNWLVVYDEPGDKASLRWEVRAPADRAVITNGELVEVRDEGDGTRTWVRDFPWQIPTYLFVLDVGTYEEISHDGPVPITTWAQPPRVEAATRSFANTGEMMTHLSGLFGAYPWPSYTNVLVPLEGGMEHTLATSFGSGLVGTDWAEWINVHELAHHWWGDHVTCADWPEIWLNEGFASYAEVLWAEDQGGEEWRRWYLEDQRQTYFLWQQYEGVSPLYDPFFLFGGTVYQKGSLVLHQLRVVMGDGPFFEALQAYADAHGGDVATTEDLRAAAESVHGADLSWFFEDWVYGRGDPEYRVGLTQTVGEHAVQVDLHVDQTGDSTYRMVMPVHLVLADGSELAWTAWAEGPESTTRLCLGAEVVEATFDPGDDLLYASLDRDDSAHAPALYACDPVDSPLLGGGERSGGCACNAGPPPAGGLALILGGLPWLVLRRRRGPCDIAQRGCAAALNSSCRS